MRTTLRSIFVISLLLIAHAAIAQQRPAANKKGSYTIKLTLSDSTSREKIIGAVCQFKNLGIFAVTDVNGVATLKSVPAGETQLEINYLGYENYTRTLRIKADMSLNIRLTETSLQLNEVHVVAKSSAAGSSTASKIGRQAIDHLQATNLGDLMQLLPGQVIQNKDLTSTSQLQIRTLTTGDNNNSFGASVMVDGIPISNNANLNEKAGINSTASSGIDVRQIGADNIESVEVIRGIPSAEYGDLTSGAVIVKSKSGKTPYEIRTKVNPSAINTSFGKGWALGEKRGFLNSSFDYVQAWGDPRQKVASFDRISGSLTYSRTLFRKWNTKTKASVNSLLDWRGQDPDEIANGTKTTQTDVTLQLSHDGKIALNLPLARTISYVVGYSTARKESKTSTIVDNSSGYMPLLTGRESGYFNVPYLNTSYFASGGTIGTPQSYYFKLSNSFGFKLEPSTHQFNMGVEYRNESNKGRGYYNENEALPLSPNSDGRPRPFYDIPALNQLSGYIEDNMTWKILGKKLKLQAGVRYTHLQPGKEEQVWSLSPRLNASIELSKWFALRGGYGKNSKTPGLIHLYPDKKYMDRAASLPNTTTGTVLYNTNVYDVKRTLGLDNATNTKIELGFDINLPEERRISIVGYRDLTPNGFGNYSEYFTYLANYYATTNPTVGVSTPNRVDTVFSTKGTTGNTQWSENRGIEFDFDLGQVKAWHTSFYLTGAYMESRTKTTGPSFSNPYQVYYDANTPPFKYLYPSGRQMSIDKRLSSSLRTVFSLPRLRMVISSTLQVIWFTSSETTNQREDPLGYLDTDLSYHPITQEMLDNPNYRIKGLLLALDRRSGTDYPKVTQPPIWMMNTRLTKDISKMAGFSFYVNNTLFYQPWQRSSVSSTLTERNQGTFSFGMEMYFKF